MGSYCPVCDQFVENLDVCSRGEYHTPPEPEPEPLSLEEKLTSDEIWYQREIRTRSKSRKHREGIIYVEISKIIASLERTAEKQGKVALFEEILIIFKNNKGFIKNHKNLANVTIQKIDTFSEYSSEFNHLTSFKYQIFGTC